MRCPSRISAVPLSAVWAGLSAVWAGSLAVVWTAEEGGALVAAWRVVLRVLAAAPVVAAVVMVALVAETMEVEVTDREEAVKARAGRVPEEVERVVVTWELEVVETVRAAAGREVAEAATVMAAVAKVRVAVAWAERSAADRSPAKSHALGTQSLKPAPCYCHWRREWTPSRGRKAHAKE